MWSASTLALGSSVIVHPPRHSLDSWNTCANHIFLQRIPSYSHGSQLGAQGNRFLMPVSSMFGAVCCLVGQKQKHWGRVLGSLCNQIYQCMVRSCCPGIRLWCRTSLHLLRVIYFMYMCEWLHSCMAGVWPHCFRQPTPVFGDPLLISWKGVVMGLGYWAEIG